MRKKRKLGLSLLLCLSLLAGCGMQELPQSTTIAPSENETKPIEITLPVETTQVATVEQTEEETETESEKVQETEKLPGYITNAMKTDGSVAIVEIPWKWEELTSAYAVHTGNYVYVAQQVMEEGDLEEIQEYPLGIDVYDLERGEITASIILEEPGLDPYQMLSTNDGNILLYNAERTRFIWLDHTLKKIASTDLLSTSNLLEEVDMTSLFLDDNGYVAYIVHGVDLYRYDLKTGIGSVLLKDMIKENSYVVDVLFSGRVLICQECSGNNYYYCYYDIVQGERVFVTTQYYQIKSSGDVYTAMDTQDMRATYIYIGNKLIRDRMTTILVPQSLPCYSLYMSENCDRLYGMDQEKGQLAAYDYKNGVWYRKSLDLVEQYSLSWVGELEGSKPILMGSDLTQQKEYLIIWDPKQDHLYVDSQEPAIWDYSSVADQKEMQDTPELLPEFAQLNERVDQLEEQYGISIFFANECSNIIDTGYDCTIILEKDLILAAINALDQALSAYPAGFFAQLHSSSYSEGLVIYLCGDLIGREGDGLAIAGGLTTVSPMAHIMVLNITGDVERVFYHETSHVIDNHIQMIYESGTPFFTEEKWQALNPEGFTYGQNYGAYDTGEVDSKYTFESYIFGQEKRSNVYFYSNYGKTFATEDRAVIMEQIMKYDDDERFLKTQHIVDKAEYIDQYIRHYFQSDDWPETANWELIIP